ncbi:MAG: ATP-binding protein, partial [Pseudomonadota bacterium]
LNLKRANEELQAAKAYTESIIQNFLDTLIVVDAEAKMQTMNPATCNLLGYTEEELIGQPIGVIFAEEEEARRFFQFFRGSEKAQALGPQDVIRNRELTCRAKDGRLIPMSFNASVITDEGGNVTGVVAGAKDITDLKQITEKITKINEELRAEITERKRLEAQLIHSTKMASLGVMASGIAHEIRNPLAVCSSAAQFLLENPHDRVLREQCADKIYSNVQRAARIIENLLKFARPSAADRGRVDLNETLEATLSLTENQIALQQIKLSRQFAEDLPPVIGSSSLLQQVFLNIIFNAANAMPGGGKLTISTLVNPEREAEVRFADTGCGIPQEHLDNIFDPFFTTMPVGRGTGLGLSVSYGIIQQHGGSIEVESSVGAGTTFTVKLPLRDAP